jgi:HEAT repeat protein
MTANVQARVRGLLASMTQEFDDDEGYHGAMVAASCARQLKHLGAAAVEPLLAALAGDNRLEATVAAETLGELGDLRAVDGLIEALRSTDRTVCQAVADALGRLGDPRAAPSLVAVLQHRRDEDARGRAARALGRLGSPEALAPLMTMVAAPSEPGWVRRAAAEALGDLGDPAAAPLLQGLLNDASRELRESAVQALGALALPQTFEALLPLLHDPHPLVRRAVVRALTRVDLARAGPVLIAALAHETDDYVIKGIFDELSTHRVAGALDPLIAALDHHHHEVRLDAVEALGQLGDRRAAEPLCRVLLTERDQHRRWRAAAALKELQAPEAVETLLGLLADEDEFVQREAIQALGGLQEPRAIPALARLLEDTGTSLSLRIPFSTSLTAHAAQEALVAIGPPAIPALLAALTVPISAVRSLAASALRALGVSEFAVPPLSREEETVAALARALEHKSYHIRWSAVWQLAAIATSEAEALLRAALVDPNLGVRMLAAEVLGKRGDRRAVPALVAALGDGRREVRTKVAVALGQVPDPQAVTALITALQDRTQAVRRAAATALGQQGDPRAIAPLEALLDGPPDKAKGSKVVAAVRKALAQLQAPPANEAGAGGSIASGRNEDQGRQSRKTPSNS